HETLHNLSSRFHLGLDPSRSFDEKHSLSFCRILSIYSIYLLYRNNIASGNYMLVDLSELNVEFNKVIKDFDVNVRKHIALSLQKSPQSAYKERSELVSTLWRFLQTQSNVFSDIHIEIFY